jgi:hypothetical protein
MMTTYLDLHGSDESLRQDIECKQCGKGGLHWEEEFDGSYRLYTAKDMLHKCDEKRLHKAVADDFEVLP